jgi:hypothetical protein
MCVRPCRAARPREGMRTAARARRLTARMRRSAVGVGAARPARRFSIMKFEAARSSPFKKMRPPNSMLRWRSRRVAAPRATSAPRPSSSPRRRCPRRAPSSAPEQPCWSWIRATSLEPHECANAEPLRVVQPRDPCKGADALVGSRMKRRTPPGLLHFARNLAELQSMARVRVPGGPPTNVAIPRGWRGAESAGLRLDSSWLTTRSVTLASRTFDVPSHPAIADQIRLPSVSGLQIEFLESLRGRSERPQLVDGRPCG